MTFDIVTFVGGFADPPVAWLDAGVFEVVANNNIDGDEIELLVDRTGIANGVNQTTVTLNYTDGVEAFSLNIAVRMQVGASTVTSDTVFVLLIDPETLETRYQTETEIGANFSFSIADVEAGIYLLVAGTDRNNDDVLGDPGELFGAYPSIDTPQPVEVVEGQSAGSLNFGLQELVTVQTLANPHAVRAYRRLY